MWTADVYLLMSLKRPDIWPVIDIAQAAAHEIKGLEVRPDADELTESANSGGRHSVAASILWHHYLNTPRLSTPRKR